MPMCGRFYVPDEFSEIKIRLGVGDFGPAPNWEPSYNVAPTEDALALRSDMNGKRVVEKMYWTLIPSTWKAKPKFPTFNARAETIDRMAVFKSAWTAGRRCAVPAGGFYEWKKGPNGRQPYAIALKDTPTMLLAGLWEDWVSPDGEKRRTMTIITTAPNDFMKPIHNRMPVILAADDLPRWIGEEKASPAELKKLLGPFPSEPMRRWPVSDEVNNWRNDGPQLIRPVPEKDLG
jgi:putative SOS response-associated peptidase YedK